MVKKIACSVMRVNALTVVNVPIVGSPYSGVVVERISILTIFFQRFLEEEL
jgi:hypothetical protein